MGRERNVIKLPPCIAGGSQNSRKVFCIMALSSPSIRGFVNKGTNDANTLLSRICRNETKIPVRILSD